MKKLIFLILFAFSLTVFAESHPDEITMMDGKKENFYFSQLYTSNLNHCVMFSFFWKSDFNDAKTKLKKLGCEIKKVDDSWQYQLNVLPDEIREIRYRNLGGYRVYPHDELMKKCY